MTWNDREDSRKPDGRLKSEKESELRRASDGHSWSRRDGSEDAKKDADKKSGSFIDIRQGLKKVQEYMGMDKLFLILLAGVLLLLSAFPFGKGVKNDSSDGQQTESTIYDNGGQGGYAVGTGDGQSWDDSAGYAAWLEKRLETVLLSVDGVGEVRVMITLKDNGMKQLQSDTVREHSNTGETDSAGGSRSIQEGREEYSTVILNNGTGDGPYITRETNPEIEGVLVVAQGAGSAAVKTEIYEAVQALFNVPAHKIKVLRGVLEN